MINVNSNPVLDYRALRLLVGIIAVTIAPIVSLIAVNHIPSISASYYTEARDVFVGMLIIVGTFLWAYNGHHRIGKRMPNRELIASKVASIAAICVALFPTAAPKQWDPTSTFNWATGPTIHWIAAGILFAILAYFCFGPFRENTKGQGGKKGYRSKIYFICGSVMVGCMLAGLIAKLKLTDTEMDELGIIYWIEAIALGAFGIAWIVAGKVIKALTSDKDIFHIHFN